MKLTSVEIHPSINPPKELLLPSQVDVSDISGFISSGNTELALVNNIGPDLSDAVKLRSLDGGNIYVSTLERLNGIRVIPEKMYTISGRFITSPFVDIPNPSFEIDTTSWGGWSPNGTTIARVSESVIPIGAKQAHDGDYILQINCVNAGNNGATNPIAQKFPVIANRLYSYSAWFRAASVSRVTRLQFAWYDVAGVLIGSVVTVVGPSDITTDWTQISGTILAPVGATGCRLLCYVVAASAGEVHYIDDIHFGIVPTIRVVKLRANWYDATGLFIGATDDMVDVETSENWVILTQTVTAPKEAVFISLVAQIDGTTTINEDHYVNKMSLFADDKCVLSFRDPTGQNPYNVKGITGLDADEIVSRYYGVSGNDKFYSLSMLKRTIVVSVGLNPDFSENQTYSDLRDDLYRMISSSRIGKIQMQFKNGTDIVAVVSGNISKFEAPHFEQNSEVQITISCDDSMLRALDPIEIDTDGLDPNTTILEDSVSTAPHGVIFELQFTADTPDLSISDPDNPGWSFNLDPVDQFLEDDILYFSSELNNKYLYLVRDDAVVNIGEILLAGSIWPIMFPGTNKLSFTHSENLEWIGIRYYPTYWGV